MKPSKAKKTGSSKAIADRIEQAAFWLSLSLIVLVPLAFTTSVHNIFSLPKFALLLTGSSAFIPVLAWSRRESSFDSLRSGHALMVSLYLLAIAGSTLFGVAPIASLFGSAYNRMGLITHLGFYSCFIALVVGIGASEKRLFQAAWAMAATGLIVATYAFIQFFGYDIFLSPALYTLATEAGPVLRVMGTLGHADYLGNFLLYTSPLSAGLAMVARGPLRRLAVIATLLSVMAIAFSGTRGAWVGIVVGAATFAALELFGRFGDLLKTHRRMLIKRTGLAFILILGLVAVIASNPASRNITARARQFMSDGLTGSGRTLLWRDSIRMIPRYALTGCGPEAFRKAFLAYKSEELARLAPQTNNESPHNSYLDAAISFGLPGAALYIAIIVSAFMLLLGVRRRFAGRKMRLLATGLISSLAAVSAHNFFIFDQIATGLYFYAFVALALAATNVAASVEAKASNKQSAKRQSEGAGTSLWRWAFASAGLLIVIMSGWYGWSLLSADRAIKLAFESADAGDSDRVVSLGRRADEAPDPAGDYNFLFARVLTLSAEHMQASAAQGDKAEARKRIIEMATAHAESSLPHTLMPDSNYLLLAYLALQSGDTNRLGAYAARAIELDPKFFHAHWLRAEYFLARGDRPQAVSEAKVALSLFPGSLDAKRVLKRARGDNPSHKRSIEEMIALAQAYRDSGELRKAERVLLRALRRSGTGCLECHRTLAQLYESAGLYEKAITEWEIFIKETSDRKDAEQAMSRVESLKRPLR